MGRFQLTARLRKSAGGLKPTLLTVLALPATRAKLCGSKGDLMVALGEASRPLTALS